MEKYEVKKKKKVNVIITIIIEYAWICLNKQSFEYAKVLNIWDPLHSLRSMYKVLALIETKVCSEPCQATKMRLCGRIIIL